MADGLIDELIDLYSVGIKIVDPRCVFQSVFVNLINLEAHAALVACLHVCVYVYVCVCVCVFTRYSPVP